MKKRTVIFPWTEEAHYGALKAMMVDGNALPETFAGWAAAANRLEDQLAADGTVVIRVYVDPFEFKNWCSDQGHDPSCAARLTFAKILVGVRASRPAMGRR